MSRIHEALRRAEQEKGKARSPVADPDTGSVADADADKAAPAARAPAVAPATAPAAEPAAATPPARQSPSGGAAVLAAASAAVAPAQTAAAQTAAQRPPGLALLDSCRRPLWLGDASKLLFLGGTDPTFATEQLRNLRARLWELRTRRSLKSLVISSPMPSEGKTFLAANLAHALARQHDRRILLVDADLRGGTSIAGSRPEAAGSRGGALHTVLGAPGDPGLSEYLLGRAGEEQILQRSPQENLFFIPGGKPAPNPGDLLSSAKLKKLLDRLAPLFDWILLDTPPTNMFADARLIANGCDGILLVIQAGATSRDAARSAAREFPADRLLGVVINRVAVAGR